MAELLDYFALNVYDDQGDVCGMIAVTSSSLLGFELERSNGMYTGSLWSVFAVHANSQGGGTAGSTQVSPALPKEEAMKRMQSLFNMIWREAQ